MARISAAVVAQVKHQILHIRGLELVDGGDELLLGGGGVIVEQQVAEVAAGRGQHPNGRYRIEGDRGGLPVSRHAWCVPPRSLMPSWSTGATGGREHRGVDGIHARLGVHIDHVHAIDGRQLSAAAWPASQPAIQPRTYSTTRRRGGVLCTMAQEMP